MRIRWTDVEVWCNDWYHIGGKNLLVPLPFHVQFLSIFASLKLCIYDDCDT